MSVSFTDAAESSEIGPKHGPGVVETEKNWLEPSNFNHANPCEQGNTMGWDFKSLFHQEGGPGGDFHPVQRPIPPPDF